MSRQAIACFQALLSSGTIDAENGIITGVHVLENGKLATFEGPDGKVKSVTITSKHVNALLKHAGNRTLQVHLSHDWYGTEDGIKSQVARLKNHRVENGNLVADLYLAPGDYRDTALWNAQNDPGGMMLSAVFGYLPNDPECIPQDYKAADIVETGAGVTALFSAHKTLHTAKLMEVADLVTLLADPAVKTAIKAIVDSHEDAAPAADEVAEMEDAAGVTPSDDEKKDTSPSAMMKRFCKAAIVVAKLAKSKTIISDEQETALLTKAEASFVKKIGSGKIQLNLSADKDTQDGEAYITAQLAADCPNRATAIARMSKDKPEVYATFRGQKQAA